MVRYEDREEETDAAIAPLILELWKAEIDTLGSGADSPPGWVCIEFFCGADVESFLDIVTQYDPDKQGMYNRILGRFWATIDHWRYGVSLVDCALDEEFDPEIGGHKADRGWTAPADVRLGVSVRFPRYDYPAVLERMQRHNLAPKAEDSEERDTTVPPLISLHGERGQHVLN